MKKSFFTESTKTEIKEKERIDLSRIIKVKDLEDSQFGVLPSSILIPRGFENARKFMKHGREVKPRRFYSLGHASEDGRTPIQLREEAFNNIQNLYYCSYSIMPFGKDERKRKIALIECLEAARIFAFSHQFGKEILIKPYDDAFRVKKDGAEIIAKVPSRTKNHHYLEFKLMSVPIIDSTEKYRISLNFNSDHSCPSKRFNIRYKYLDDKESSSVINICAHEIAAYLKTIEYYWNIEKNIIPIQMCHFAIPTQETVNYYLKFENNLLIFDESIKPKDKLRKPNRGEKEIGLWALVAELDYDKTFYSKKSRDGDVADYNWSIK